MLTLLPIICLAFFIMSGLLSSAVGNYLFERLESEERSELEDFAVRIAPDVQANNAENVRSRLAAYGGQKGSRVLFLDKSGKVQMDSFGLLNGTRITYPEIDSIAIRGNLADYGLYCAETGEKLDIGKTMFSGMKMKQCVSYCTAGIVSSSDISGILFCVTSVQETLDQLSELQQKIGLIFSLSSVAVLLCMMILGKILMRPLKGFMNGIQGMSSGNFSARVPVKGSGEIKKLALAFNGMAEKISNLDQSRNEFVSNASHELKTPLATIKIMLESVIYQPDMAKELRTEFLNDINSEIDRLSRIVSDLLTLVRMDSSTIRLNRQSFSIAALIKEISHRLGPNAETRHQKITLSLSDPCDIYADKNRIDQVIYNLMENAVKYTQNGGEICVSLERKGHNAVMKVSDNGPGIPANALSSLFERFYRADKARSRETGGTGLGLSIVRQIVLLHGGDITVESTEGKGSTFTVTLPLHQG